jgi:hypothetical protein
LGNSSSFISSSCFRHPEESATRVEGKRSPPGPPARTADSVGPESTRPRLRTLPPRSGSRSYRPCPAAPRSEGAHTPLPSFRRALLPVSWCVHPNNALERLRGDLFVGVHLYVAHPCPRRIGVEGEPAVHDLCTSTIRLLISYLVVITLSGEESRCHGTRVLTCSGRAVLNARVTYAAQSATSSNRRATFSKKNGLAKPILHHKLRAQKGQLSFWRARYPTLPLLQGEELCRTHFINTRPASGTVLSFREECVPEKARKRRLQCLTQSMQTSPSLFNEMAWIC